MKKIFTIISFFYCICVNAQPSLLSTEMAAFGNTYFYKHMAAFTAIDTNLHGSGLTWNFNALSATPDPDFSVRIFNPAITSFATMYPTANWGTIEGPDTVFNFYHLSSAKMERVGTVSTTSTDTFSDPQIEYVFPLQLGSSSVDPWTSSGSSFPGTYTLNCLGIGTLTIPGHTFTDVLYVHAIQNNVIATDVFFWYDSNNGIPIVEYIPGNIFLPESGVYLYNQTNGVDIKEYLSNIRYANPVSKQFDCSFSLPVASSLHFTLFNGLGQTISNGMLEKSVDLHLRIDMEDLSKGIYFLLLKNDNNPELSKTLKIVKE